MLKTIFSNLLMQILPTQKLKNSTLEITIRVRYKECAFQRNPALGKCDEVCNETVCVAHFSLACFMKMNVPKRGMVKIFSQWFLFWFVHHTNLSYDFRRCKIYCRASGDHFYDVSTLLLHPFEGWQAQAFFTFIILNQQPGNDSFHWKFTFVFYRRTSLEQH